MKQWTAWILILVMLCTCICAGAEDVIWELEEEETILEEAVPEETVTEETVTEPAAAEDAGLLDLDDDWFSDLDLNDSFAQENAEDLQPMTEEELLKVLAEQDETDFLVIPEDSATADTDVYTLLLIGSDSYEEDKRGRADTTILVQINADRKTIKMVSFLRDMYVNIPGRSANRLNAAYIWGGDRLLRKTLRSVFGVEADAYMEVNFARLIRLIDAIGGIDVDVSEAEQKQVNSILRFYNTYTGDREEDQLLWEWGEKTHLTGKQALCYARIRKIDNDFARTERQRKVIEAGFHKVMQLTFAEITKVVTENLDAVATDLSAGDVLRLIPMAIRCQNAEISTMTIPSAGGYHSQVIGGMSVIVPNLRGNRNKLKNFLAID